ncbi:AraC family transcriptional regulator [Paenibacillus sp. HB172176]|uniref:AraC family transcriptional regulator n=1 Tax=Paenibacillus sp. HB172176 TaxID=2493690 RepID=UPI00143C981A|nr:AraC family transcriptional regulator [Paenibacillus sp. HB172176]
MNREHSGLIERIELKEQFFLHHRVRQSEYYYFHAHQGIEILFIHEGEGQVIIGDQLAQVSKGSLLLIQPYQLHKIHMRDELGYERSVLVFDPSAIDSRLAAFPALQRFYRSLWRSKLPVQHFALNGNGLAPEAERLLTHCQGALQAAERERRLEEIALTVVALLQLLRRVFPSDETTLDDIASHPRSMRYAEKAMQWIEAHFNEEFQLSRLADDLFVSPSHLSRLFHQETGATLTEYITARRLREACLLLTATALSAGEIAGRVGLKNAPYFGRLFRRNIGMTPVQYRNRKRENSL